MAAHILDSASASISLPPLCKHSRGATPVLLHDLVVWQWFLGCDRHSRCSNTVCWGVRGERWRNSFQFSKPCVWDRLLTQRLPQSAFDANRCGHSVSATSQVLMRDPLWPRPSRSATVASVPEGLMVIQGHLSLWWLHHQNSEMRLAPEFRDENFSSELKWRVHPFRRALPGYL